MATEILPENPQWNEIKDYVEDRLNKPTQDSDPLFFDLLTKELPDGLQSNTVTLPYPGKDFIKVRYKFDPENPGKILDIDLMQTEP